MFMATKVCVNSIAAKLASVKRGMEKATFEEKPCIHVGHLWGGDAPEGPIS